MKQLKTAFGFILALVLFPLIAQGSGKCSSSYYQGCGTCEDLQRITKKAEANEGDYYRAAQWNGLYTAYVLNCVSVAKELLDRGANPNWGGSLGSMVLSVSDKWPHNDKKINLIWAHLLLRYGADARKKVPDQEQTPEQTAKQDAFTADYPELFRLFLRQ